jgi:hypothetical protein
MSLAQKQVREAPKIPVPIFETWQESPNVILSPRRRRTGEGRGMEIDRRNLLTTGLAATAAAILPAFPAQALAPGVRRFYFLDGPIYSDLPPLPDGFRSAILDAVWHFDPNHGGPWLIRHVPTGLTCRRAPQEHDRLALQAVSIDAELADWPESFVATVGRAARFVAVHASLVCGCRPWHEGAVFFHYPQVDPRDPYNLPLSVNPQPRPQRESPPRGAGGHGLRMPKTSA